MFRNVRLRLTPEIGWCAPCLPSAANIDATFRQRDAIPVDWLMRIPQDEKIVGTECRPGPALPFVCCADTGEEDDDRHRLGNAESFDRSERLVFNLITDLIIATGERLLQPLRT